MRKALLVLMTVLMTMQICACSRIPEIDTACSGKEPTLADVREPVPVVEDFLPDDLSSMRRGEVTHIVIHFLSNVTDSMTDPYNYNDIIKLYKDNQISSHYLIGRDGSAYYLVPLDHTAFHAGKGTLEGYPQYENRLNEHSVGIEIMAIGSPHDMEIFFPTDEYKKLDPSLLGFTDAQYDTLNALIDEIVHKYPSIKKDRRHIIGHSEYSPKKTDPGELFDWSRLNLS